MVIDVSPACRARIVSGSKRGETQGGRPWSDSDLSHYLHVVSQAIEELLDVAAVGFSMPDPRGELQVGPWTSAEVSDLTGLELREHQGPAVDCYATGQPVVNISATEARRRWPSVSTRVVRAGLFPAHALPLHVGGHRVGVLSLYFARPRLLRAAELSMCRVLLQVAGIGLEQAKASARRHGGPGSSQERYQVGELIGHGGMAEVYLAHDVDRDRVVALKMPRPERMGDPGLVDRFRREGRTAARLEHPNIVSVLSTGESEIADVGGGRVRRPFIVMEHVAGVTLRKRISADGPMGLEEALRILADVLSALTYIHDQGVVHGDLTATNVMLSAEGEVKLTDFGSSHAFTGSDPGMTQSVEVTLAYSSPERAQGQPSDTRADLYSAGCLLYELLTGCTPFVGDSPVDVAYQHVHETPPQPSRHRLDVGARLDAVVLRALAKTPDERYQSAQQFRRDLLATRSDPSQPEGQPRFDMAALAF